MSSPTNHFGSNAFSTRRAVSLVSAAWPFGRIEPGFDFLGYRFIRAGLTLARATLENFVERWRRLYPDPITITMQRAC
jgi:hypothetical protein